VRDLILNLVSPTRRSGLGTHVPYRITPQHCSRPPVLFSIIALLKSLALFITFPPQPMTSS